MPLNNKNDFYNEKPGHEPVITNLGWGIFFLLIIIVGIAGFIVVGLKNLDKLFIFIPFVAGFVIGFLSSPSRGRSLANVFWLIILLTILIAGFLSLMGKGVFLGILVIMYILLFPLSIMLGYVLGRLFRRIIPHNYP